MTFCIKWVGQRGRWDACLCLSASVCFCKTFCFVCMHQKCQFLRPLIKFKHHWTVTLCGKRPMPCTKDLWTLFLDVHISGDLACVSIRKGQRNISLEIRGSSARVSPLMVPCLNTLLPSLVDPAPPSAAWSKTHRRLQSDTSHRLKQINGSEHWNVVNILSLHFYWGYNGWGLSLHFPLVTEWVGGGLYWLIFLTMFLKNRSWCAISMLST